MNKRIIAIVVTVALVAVFGVILAGEYQNRQALKDASDSNSYVFEEVSTEEQEETEKPIEVKENKDDGFSELIPLTPVTQ